MKRFSQTLKVALALFVAIFANGTLTSITAYAAQASDSDATSQTETSSDTTAQPVTEQEEVTDDTPSATDESDVQSTVETPLVPQFVVETYKPASCQTSDISILSKNANLTEVTIALTRTAADQNKTCVVSLNSYETEGQTWETSGTQTLIDHDQVTLSGRNQATLKVKAPKCFGQTDMYLGSTLYDGKDGPLPHYPTTVVPKDLIKYWNGGEKCPVPTIKPCKTITDQPLVTNDSYANYSYKDTSEPGSGSGIKIVGGQDTRSKGHYSFGVDGLHIWTEDNSSQSKVAWYHSFDYALSAVGEPAMDYAVTTGAAPGLQLVVDFDNDGTPDGILVGESIYTGNNWWLASSTNLAKNSAPHDTAKGASGGQGGQWYGTLNEWLAAFPNAKVKAVGFSLGSGVYASGVLRSLTFGCVKWTFGLKEVRAQAPKFTDLCGTESDTVWIPSVEGVTYKLNGQVVTPGYHSVGKGLITVTAEAKAGYSLKGDSKWTKCFTNNQDCVTITKEALPVTDTNNDGVIGVGDVVTWTITVTNNSKNDLDNFRIELTDSTATIVDNADVTGGVIKYLKHGTSVTVTATSTLTANDVKACQATNTVEFQGWYTHKHTKLDKNGREEIDSLSQEGTRSVLEGSSNEAIAPFTCPTPGSGSGGSTTTSTSETPEVLPSTGPSQSGNPFVVIMAAVVAYGATYFVQRRRETSVN